MANWCNNTVVFEGTKKSIAQVQQQFQMMKAKEEKEERGQLPDFVMLYNGYFFDLYWNEGDVGIFQYQTKWSPNIEILQQIADHFKIDFVLDYEEMGNLIYGRASYSNAELTDIYLEDDDFQKYTYDNGNDWYYFEGEKYESDCQILETLLERKIEHHSIKKSIR